MAIKTSYNAKVEIGGVDLSDHCRQATVVDAGGANDISCMGDTYHVFRPGLSNASMTFNFRNDQAAGSVGATLRGLISLASTGTEIYCRYENTTRSTSNPEWYMTGIVDGDINLMDDTHGEVPEISVKFVPYSTFTVYTSST